jgi:hypothetical protein
VRPYPSLGVLIAVRVAQGVCGGLLVPAGQTILGQAAGVTALFLGLRIIPRGQARTAGHLDVTGLLLVSSGLPLLTYGIIAASAAHSITGAPALTRQVTAA